MNKVYEGKNGTKIRLINGDCMEALRGMKENQYDLAIVDPPYGINEDGGKDRRGKSKHKKKRWDNNTPTNVYFDEIKRTTKNQIIWGANYFNMPPSMGYVCWDKKLDNSDFSDFELAYTSFERAAKIFRFSKNGGSRTFAALADIIHPTQKPVQLYKWLLKNYAEEGQTILDTHGGSMSIAIACYDMGFDLTCYELDKDYYNAAVKRFEKHIQQSQLF